MIIQIGGLLAKRVVSDNKFAKIMIIQIWRLPHRRRFGTTNLQTIMIFHIWQPLCIFGKVVVIIWMRRPLSKRMMILTIIILMIILKVYLVSWCAAHCICMLIIRCDWFSLEPMPETPWAKASSFKGLNAIRFVVVLNQLLHNILY